MGYPIASRSGQVPVSIGSGVIYEAQDLPSPVIVAYSTQIPPVLTTTLDATPTVILSVPVPLANGLALDVMIVGTKRDRSVSECWRILASFTNAAGTASNAGSAHVLGPTGTSLGLITVGVDGSSNATVITTGAVATVDWSVSGVTLVSTG